MVAILQDKREAIAELCARYGVARLEVFGSARRDDFRPGESDVDLLVEFGPMDGYARAVACFDLLDKLHELLGVEVDLVMTGAVRDRFIARDIQRTRQPPTAGGVPSVQRSSVSSPSSARRSVRLGATTPCSAPASRTRASSSAFAAGSCTSTRRSTTRPSPQSPSTTCRCCAECEALLGQVGEAD